MQEDEWIFGYGHGPTGGDLFGTEEGQGRGTGPGGLAGHPSSVPGTGAGRYDRSSFGYGVGEGEGDGDGGGTNHAYRGIRVEVYVVGP